MIGMTIQTGDPSVPAAFLPKALSSLVMELVVVVVMKDVAVIVGVVVWVDE